MKTTLINLCLILASVVAPACGYAANECGVDWPLYAYEQGGQTSLLCINPEAGTTPAAELAKQGKPGNLTVTQITKADVPADRKDRNFWKLSGGKVVVDTAKKQVAEDTKRAVEDRFKLKAKLNEQDLEDLAQILKSRS